MFSILLIFIKVLISEPFPFALIKLFISIFKKIKVNIHDKEMQADGKSKTIKINHLLEALKSQDREASILTTKVR